MATVECLLPGDLIGKGGQKGLYLGQGIHPVWPQLKLVIWRLEDGSLSFDALSRMQDVGEYIPPCTRQARISRLHAAGYFPDHLVMQAKNIVSIAAEHLAEARVAEDPEAWAWE
jgi:hypothetical protein